MDSLELDFAAESFDIDRVPQCHLESCRSAVSLQGMEKSTQSAGREAANIKPFNTDVHDLRREMIMRR